MCLITNSKLVPPGDCALLLVFASLSHLSTGGECFWRRRGRGSPGRVDSSVRGVCVETRGGRPLSPQGHWRTAVSDRGAVWATDPRSEGSSRHVGPQPAQPVESHGGHLYETQWEPGRQPRLQSPTHWVLTLAFLLCCCHFPFFLSICHCVPTSVPNYTSTSTLSPAPFLLSHFSLLLTFPSLCEETVPKSVTNQGTVTSSYQNFTSFTFIVL